MSRQSTFETAEINVRVLKPSDPLPTPETLNKDIPSGGLIAQQPFPITYGSRKVNGVRQSKRIRQVNGQNKRRKLGITKEMTVKELKVEVGSVSVFLSLLAHHLSSSSSRVN